MKFIIALLLVINPFNDLDKVAKVNKAKKEAERAYLAEDYKLANEYYTYLKDSLGVEDEKLLLNLANTQFILEDSVNAEKAYNSLKESPNNMISSIANQQLGAMEFNNKKYEESLQHYKNSLKRNPSNEDARYNYELLKKLIKEQEEQQEQNKDQNKEDQENKDQEKKDQEKQDQDQQDQENKDQQDQEKQDQEKQDQEEKQNQEEEQENQEKKEQEQEEQKPEDQEKEDEEKDAKPNPIDEEKLKEMQITEEKAKLILEAMRNNEVQYIQQNKRKAKKKKDPDKPDW